MFLAGKKHERVNHERGIIMKELTYKAVHLGASLAWLGEEEAKKGI